MDFPQKVVTAFAERTGYSFKDPELLSRALTHASHGGSPKIRSYERLEFLGDRVLGLVIAEELFHKFPDQDEGAMARQYNYLVRKETCAKVARELDVALLVRTGRSMEDTSGATSTRVLGDACEAIIAALYIDGGLDSARALIHRYWKPHFETAVKTPKDPKTTIQEWALSQGLPMPAYSELSCTGPDHEPVFTMAVRVQGFEDAVGEAGGKRHAEQEAAKAFIARERIKAQ